MSAEPGAPRARSVPGKPRILKPEPPPPDPVAGFADITWKKESIVDADPELLTSDTPIHEHKYSTDKLTSEIRYWRELGFWPRTVSALVGLRLEDCNQLYPPPSYQLKAQTPCKPLPASKVKSPKTSCATGAKRTQTPASKHTMPLTPPSSKQSGSDSPPKARKPGRPRSDTKPTRPA